MKKRVSTSRFGLQYEAFLFEPLGDDRNGAPLALASILGRMSLDPWQEAAALAALPTQVAAGRLASLIEAMPNRALTHSANSLAERLIKLLPVAPKAALPESDSAADVDARKGRRLIRYLSWFALACVLLLTFVVPT